MLDAQNLSPIQELYRASDTGNLEKVIELLSIPAVRDNAAASSNYALRLAARSGHLAVVNCLLEIPNVMKNVTAFNNAALDLASSKSHDPVVFRLLEIPEVLLSAPQWHLSGLSKTVENYDLRTACTLLKLPNVRRDFESSPRVKFLTVFKKILKKIQENSPLAFKLDENGNVISTTYERGPLDAEIDIVNIMRDIGLKHKISAADFTQEEFGILEFVRRVNDTLYFKVSTHTPLRDMLMAGLASEKKHFDPAAPATSAGTPSILVDDVSHDETDPTKPGPSQPKQGL